MKDTSNKTKKGACIFDIIFIAVIIVLVALVLAKMLGVTFPFVGRDQSVSESLGNPRGSQTGKDGSVPVPPMHWNKDYVVNKNGFPVVNKDILVDKDGMPVLGYF